MAPKRKKEQSEEREDSPAPSLTSKRRKKSLQYDPLEICHELYEIIRNHKSEEGRIICESFIRAPKRRTAADYYEVVETPIDLLKIQQKLKMEEYEDLEQLTSDIELMVNNAKSYYKKGTPEYKDACDLWDLYIESKNEVISEAFGETPSERRSHRRSLTATLGDEDAEEKVRAIDESSNDSSMLPTTIASGEADDPEDMEQLFAAVMVAKDGEREISPVFQLLPSKVKYPEYYKIIKQPIDLKMIAQKLIDGGYKTMDEMEKDFFVLTKNAKIFNEPKSQIYKDAITLKKVVQSKKVELQQARAKATPKPSGSIRTRERTSAHRWSTYCASLEYPQEEQIPDISLLQEDSLNSSQVDFDEDSGSETIISEDGDPLWVLLNHVRSAKGAGGVPLSEPFLKLPSRRFYPDYYDEVKRPMSISNVRKKLKYKQYKNLDKLASDLNLVFENAKQYNADESKIYKDACLLQKIMSDKKFELEHGDTKKTPDFFDEDSRSRGRKSISLNLDSDKKKTKRASPEEMMRRRLWMIYKAVFEYTDKDGRHLREIFMELPSKRDYPDYYQVILNPMDMLTIESKIKAEKYTTEQELIADFELMFNNARHYNEEHSLVYSDANTLEKIMKNKWKNLCQTIEARRALSKNMSFSPKSNQLGNSPKDAKMRMIRAANTPLPTRLQELYNTIHNYQDVRGRNLATPFLKLPLKAEYPDYYEVIKKPIDMQRIQQKMLSSQYESVEDMVADFVQMFDNACKYNEPDSLIYKDALTLQRVCLEKKTELCHDGADVPDVRAAVVEIMTSLFIATYNFQDEEGRCYSDSFAELPERDPDEDLVTSKTKEKPLSFDQIKKNLDRGRYARMDKFQEDMFSVFERARRLSRLDSQLYEDAVEMQTFFIETRDKMCHNGELLLTPALSYTEKHLHAALESEKLEKQPLENQGMEDKKLKDPEENHDMPSEGGVESFRYKEEEFKVGDFVYIEPREKGLEPHIMLVEKLFVDANNVQSIHGNWFYRPNETFHVSTRKFLEKEVLKSDSYTSTPLSQVIGKCYVMYVKDYFKMKPENFQEQDVYVCENRYNAKHKFFKKIKIWQVPKNDSVVVVSRDIPLVPIRVTSVFADKEKDEILDDGDTSPLDKKRIDVPVEVPNGEEGAVYYDQLNTQIGTLKLGDSVYISSNREKQLICRIDKMWTNKMDQSYVCGPWFVYPCDIEHSPTRMFYKHEIFLSSCEDSVPIQNLSGKCCVLHMKDYLISRPTEISEEDVFVCECKYFELEKSLKKLGKGLKKYVLSPRVTDDEVYFFRKHVTLQKEPSPLLLRVHDDNSNSMFGLEAEESQDGDNDNTEDSFNMSISTETVPVPETKPQKKSDDTEHTKEKVQKKGKGSSMKRQISGYIIYSGEIRKTIQNENPECSFGEISRIVGLKERSRRLPSAYILFSKDIRNVVLQENPNITFGEISRVIGVKWRNLSKEDKERYEEKAKRVAEEQQAKQQEAEKAFNESLNRSQSPWDAGRMSPGSSKQGASTGFQGHFGIFHSPGTPNQGQHVNMQGLPGSNQAGMMPRPGMSPMTPGGHRPFVPFGQQGMTPVGMGPYQGSPQGQASPLVTPQSLQPGMSPGPNPGTLPGYHTGMNSSTHAALPPQASMGQGQQMAPPPPPPRPPSPMFTTAPPRTQRLLHSEAYLRYIEGLKADRPHISDWEKTFTATPENTITDESRLPTHWLGEGAGYHGNVTEALWALRDLMMKDNMNISRTLPFEALQADSGCII